MKRHILPLILIAVTSYWTIKPLFNSGYFSMHDDTQVARVIVMGRAIRNGQFPVRWVSYLGYGYGYPLYNFYGPLPYYFGGFLYAAGVDALWATKTMMAVGMLFAGVAMYIVVQARLSRLSGLLAGVLYAYAPYHAVQLYVRGAVGELWAYAFLPLIFVRNNPWIAGSALAAVILSHTIMGYVTVVFYFMGLFVYSLFLLMRKRLHFSHFDFAQCKLFTSHTSTSLSASFSLLSVGFGLSAFFWLPAAAEMAYTNVAGQIGVGANFRDHFVCIPQLWNSLWGYGGSAPGCIDGMSFKVGKFHVLLGALGLGMGFMSLRRVFWRHPAGVISMIGLGSTIMATSFSQPVWDLVPGFAYIQYPWRMLPGIVFAASALGGSVLYWIRQKWVKLCFFAVMIIVILGLNAKLFTPQTTYSKPASFFESDGELLWRVSRVSDEYLPQSFPKPESSQAVTREILVSDENRGLAVETEIDTETYVKLHVQSQAPIDVTLKRTYFPGWQYWVNGVRQRVRVESGLPVIRIPMSGSVVEIRFGSTPARLIGNILSILVALWFLKIYGKKTIA